MLVCPFRWYTRTYSTSISDGNSIVTSWPFASSLGTHGLVPVMINGSAMEVIRTGDTQVQHNGLEYVITCEGWWRGANRHTIGSSGINRWPTPLLTVGLVSGPVAVMPNPAVCCLSVCHMKPSVGLLGSVQCSKPSRLCQRVRLGQCKNVTYRECGTVGLIIRMCPTVVGSTTTQPVVLLNPYTWAQQSTNSQH
jgi:hypothetical protein